MIDVTIAPLPPVPIYALEIWSNAQGVATCFAKAKGFALPPMGKSGGNDAMKLVRFEPTVWLAEGDVEGLADILGEDGALTAIGGGLVRVALSGPGWRRLPGALKSVKSISGIPRTRKLPCWTPLTKTPGY